MTSFNAVIFSWLISRLSWWMLSDYVQRSRGTMKTYGPRSHVSHSEKYPCKLPLHPYQAWISSQHRTACHLSPQLYTPDHTSQKRWNRGTCTLSGRTSAPYCISRDTVALGHCFELLALARPILLALSQRQMEEYEIKSASEEELEVEFIARLDVAATDEKQSRAKFWSPSTSTWSSSSVQAAVRAPSQWPQLQLTDFKLLSVIKSTEELLLLCMKKQLTSGILGIYAVSKKSTPRMKSGSQWLAWLPCHPCLSGVIFDLVWKARSYWTSPWRQWKSTLMHIWYGSGRMTVRPINSADASLCISSSSRKTQKSHKKRRCHPTWNAAKTTCRPSTELEKKKARWMRLCCRIIIPLMAISIIYRIYSTYISS